MAVAGQVMQVTPLETTTCGASGVLCRDFRALGPFKAFLVVCLGCYSINVAGEHLQMCLTMLFPRDVKYRI